MWRYKDDVKWLLQHTRSASRYIELCLNSTPHQQSAPDICNLSLAFSFTHTGCTIPFVVGQRRSSVDMLFHVYSDKG
jgi:hypothetical protein